jgi:hypothetical protein
MKMSSQAIRGQVYAMQRTVLYEDRRKGFQVPGAKSSSQAPHNRTVRCRLLPTSEEDLL